MFIHIRSEQQIAALLRKELLDKSTVSLLHYRSTNGCILHIIDLSYTWIQPILELFVEFYGHKNRGRGVEI